MKKLEQIGAAFDEPIEPRPECPAFFEFFFVAFNRLKPSMVKGAIPFPAIESYLKLFPFYDVELFIDVLNAIASQINQLKEES